MKRRDGILGALSLLLVLALLVGLCSALLGAGRATPANPIRAQQETLYPEALQGSGHLQGEETTVPTQEPTQSEEPTEPTQESTEPGTQPEETQETEPTEGDEQPEPTALPSAPETGDDNQGDEDPGDEDGGSDDSGDEDDGNHGGDDGSGDDGGDGDGGDEDDTPRIYTDLETRSVTREELPDGKLHFVAYPLGKGEQLYLRVRLKNKTNAGNGLLLTSADGENYEALLDFNAENTFVLSLYDGDTFLGTVQYRISYYEDLADDEHPERGAYPPSIVTNLDGASLDMTSTSFPLTVIARTHSDLGAQPIYSNQIQVSMDGQSIGKSYGDTQPTYELYFDAPQQGDEEQHVVRVLAWDGRGNSTLKIYTVTYHQISEGDPAGAVELVLDATTVGLGVLDSGTVSIVEGETAASVVLRFLEEYGYEVDYQGNPTMNFYLRRIYRADMAYLAAVPERLWSLILRDGIPTNENYDRDSLGEFDYTMGSGWMYSINGTLYEGTGLSGYKVRDGITIYLRFTLSYGKDIGGYDATGGGYGKLSSYCGIWINGGYQALGHDFVETARQEPTQTEDGFVRYTCTKCQETKEEILPATGEGEIPEPSEPEPSEPGSRSAGATRPEATLPPKQKMMQPVTEREPDALRRKEE